MSAHAVAVPWHVRAGPDPEDEDDEEEEEDEADVPLLPPDDDDDVDGALPSTSAGASSRGPSSMGRRSAGAGVPRYPSKSAPTIDAQPTRKKGRAGDAKRMKGRTHPSDAVSRKKSRTISGSATRGLRLDHPIARAAVPLGVDGLARDPTLEHGHDVAVPCRRKA
jgi:hypothetical protein